ncbi:hypothetical protein LXL04_005404 [Taraxacum kok-saghyz]
MKPKEYEWREVRKRKPGSSGERGGTGASEDLTSFYVTNIPNGIRKEDVWNPCAKIGDLADVYLAGRRDSSGSYFAFIKYRRVQDVEVMEQALNKIILWGKNIKANISKHPRKLLLANGRKMAPPQQRVPPHQPFPHHGFPPRDLGRLSMLQREQIRSARDRQPPRDLSGSIGAIKLRNGLARK